MSSTQPHVMLCYVMLCYFMLCHVILCYVMLCYVSFESIVLHWTIKRKIFKWVKLVIQNIYNGDCFFLLFDWGYFLLVVFYIQYVFI